MIDFRLYDFDHAIDCTYDDEHYSVRDNGAVLRHLRPCKRLRMLDNHWTFGKPNTKNGYMYIADIRIHRIVATAFHGEPPTKEHVVDHIDTNRRNNRPDNLRWLTRLENVLKNPITMKRIEITCGSIEAFLENPSILGNSKFDRNFEWMRTVSPEEAKACKERMGLWAKSDKLPSGGFLGEWLYKPKQNFSMNISRKAFNLAITKAPSATLAESFISPEVTSLESTEENFISVYRERSDLVISLTSGAAQRKWSTPTEFPCCPQSTEEDPIRVYAENLSTGAVFARNQFSTSVVLESAIVDDGQSLLVMNQKTEKDAMKPWSLAKVTYEDGLYVHTSCETFFMQDGAEKQFCLARGLEWTGEDTMDEFC